jgi:1-acyl-sn-glycerol-3-phosphate acyltransferase
MVYVRTKGGNHAKLAPMNNLPYGTLRAFLTPFLMVLFRPKVKGLRNVPASGPLILASNHLSFSDSIFMPLVVPRKVTFLAKSEYFTSPGPKGLLKKLTFIALGQVPVDRSGGRRSEAALITGLEVLAGGNSLGIYPEGTRSPDGRLYKGRTGIARLAIESGAVDCVFVSDGISSLIEKISLCSEPYPDYAIRELVPQFEDLNISQEGFQNASVALDTLESKETQVLKAFCQLKSIADIAKQTQISKVKVEEVLTKIQTLLMLDTRSQLVLRMYRFGALAL